MAKLKPCPFCGGEVDPEGWLSNNDLRGPECNGCGATTCDVASWEMRVDLNPVPLGMSPRQAFEHHVQSPNLFRSLARRLAEFAIYMKVSSALGDVAMEEGSIGPDCARASLLFTALADVTEEAKE